MRSKHIFLGTCQLTILILIHLTHIKRVSTNVANFRSLGYRPDQVALELGQLQNAYSAPRYQEASYGPYAEGEERPMNIGKLRAGQRKSIRFTGEREDADTEVETDADAKKRFAVKDVVIDFDELVNKVKDKLKDEFNEKKRAGDQQNVYHGRKRELRNNPDKDTGKNEMSLPLKNIYKGNIDQENDDDEPREAWKHFMTTESPKNSGVTADYQPSHKRKPMKKSKKQAHANDGIFELADLTKVKDSYEDYITPKRGKIYASDSDTETETRNPLPKNEGQPKENYKENDEPYNPKESYKENEEQHDPKESNNEREDQQLKYKNIPKAADIHKAGRSSDKLRKIRKLDDPINIVKDYDPNETEKPVDYSEKAMFVKLGDESDNEPVKLKGTMIPTRQFYKMSSPNYFGKLPAVAEKYDFNEPLPDKDREPEKLKYFFNPPARINKKVRLQPNSDVEQENK